MFVGNISWPQGRAIYAGKPVSRDKFQVSPQVSLDLDTVSVSGDCFGLGNGHTLISLFADHSS